MEESNVLCSAEHTMKALGGVDSPADVQAVKLHLIIYSYNLRERKRRRGEREKERESGGE